MFFPFACFENFKVDQMDVKYGFIDGNLKERVYTKNLEGFILS